MRIFILEDKIDQFPHNRIQDALAYRGHDLTIARTNEEALKIFDPPYDLWLLDHDLGGSSESPTGYDFVKWAVFKKPQDNPADVILHSSNPVGRNNMRKFLEDFDHVVAEIPFGPTYIGVLKKL